MITSLRLQNYKAFADTDKIEIKPITILLGKNNSGKSSILKALSFFKEGIANGKGSQLLLAPADGIRMGSTLLDIFHKRELVGLGFIAEFSPNLEYKIYLLGNQGEVHPYHMIINKDGKTIFEEKGSNLQASFSGLFPIKYDDELRDVFSFNVFHIGPLRKLPSAVLSMSEAVNKNFVGYAGEYTYGILLHSYLKDTELFSNVSKWFENNMDGLSLSFSSVDAIGANYVLNTVRDNVKVNITDAGLGISQVLPIITQSFINNKNTIVAIEQPVLHLHPSAHASVAARLAEAALRTGTNYVIETHSKNFLLSLRLEAIKPDTKFNREDTSIYYVYGEEFPSRLKEIEIREDGSVSYWPTGVFGEDAELLDQIIELR